jgi:hypothetical protein
VGSLRDGVELVAVAGDARDIPHGVLVQDDHHERFVWHTWPLAAEATPGRRFETKSRVILRMAYDNDEGAASCLRRLKPVADQCRAHTPSLMRGEHGHRREAQAHDNPRASVYRDGREQNVPDDGLVVDSDKGQAIRGSARGGCRPGRPRQRVQRRVR